MVAEHAGNLDDRPGDGDRLGLLGPLVEHVQLHLGARPPGQDVDGLVRTHSLGGGAVDLHDLVAGQDPGLVSRGAHHRRDHAQPAGLRVHADLDADAAELALDLLAELFPLAGVDERGMLVEVLEHSLQRALEQLPPRHGANVVGLDLLDGVDEEPVELEHLVLGLGSLRRLPAEQADRSDQRRGKHVPSWHRHVPLLVPGSHQCSVVTTPGPCSEPFTDRGRAAVS